MIQRISRKKFRIFAFDIESHNDEESIAKQETSMWLGCFIDEQSNPEDESIYFYNMDSVIDHWEKLCTPKRTNKITPIKNCATFIWNLSFEWSFILPILLVRGFTFKEDINKDDEYVFNSVSTKTCSSVWQVQIKFSKRSGIMLLRDLAKVFSGKLKDVAESFNLPTQKGEIDYRLNRLHRPPNFATPEEKEYCYKDTRIIIDILLAMQQKEDKFFWNAISAASYSTKQMIKRGWPRCLKPYKKFRETYPYINEDEDEAIFLRKTIGGGITYPTRDWQFRAVNQEIGHIDLHQAHPSSAYYHQFPYGRGEYYEGRPIMGKMCACHVRVTYDDVYLHCIISLIGLNNIVDRELWLWDFEIDLMYKCYVNLEVEYIDGWAYNTKPLVWRRYYSDNYSKRKAAKEAGDSFNVMFYKLLNNSSYGKLLERPHLETFANTIRPDGVIDSIVIPKEVVGAIPPSRYTYLPAGSAIPAFTRQALLAGALKLSFYPDEDGVTRFHKNVLYFDTDSIFFIWNEKTKWIWENEFDKEDHLGGWGWEEHDEEGNEITIQRAQFTAPKRYKLEVNGHSIIKAGGINFDKYKQDNHLDEIPFEEVDLVNSSWEIQRAYRVKGGTLIEFQVKEMGIQEKYIEIAKKNLDNNCSH